MSKKELMYHDKPELIEMIIALQGKLKRKNVELIGLRRKLSNARGKLSKMKDTVAFQRQRIIELYQ